MERLRANPRPRRGATGGGFTLVEILIVVVILAIIAALAIPYFESPNLEAEIAATRRNIQVIRQALDLYRTRLSMSQWPATLDTNWFMGNELPRNPFDPNFPDRLEVAGAGQATRIHPANRYLYTGNAPAGGAYWYNPANGIIRARVAAQSTPAESLRVYHEVNMTSEPTEEMDVHTAGG